MDAINRRRLELEGYIDLEIWDEAQNLIEEFIADVSEHPVILGVLATFGIGVEFVGDAVHDRSPASLPVSTVATAPIPEEGTSRAVATASAPAPLTLAARVESPVPHASA